MYAEQMQKDIWYHLSVHQIHVALIRMSHRCKPPLPVDRGWAWLVMLGSFINITIVISFNRASGLFVSEFLDQFQESATSTTIAFGAAPFMFSLSNILLPNVLLPRFCSRTLVFIAGILAGISVTCMAFAQSMLAITFLFGIMGFSHGFVFVPQTVLIGLYFKKRLAFANAFAYMGMAAAAIVSPIIARLLLDIYSLQGTLLLYGAFTFNILPAALLLRPVSAYNTNLPDKFFSSENNVGSEENACHLLEKEPKGAGDPLKPTSSSSDNMEFRHRNRSSSFSSIHHVDDTTTIELKTVKNTLTNLNIKKTLIGQDNHERTFTGAISKKTSSSNPRLADCMLPDACLSNDKNLKDSNSTTYRDCHNATSCFQSARDLSENKNFDLGNESKIQELNQSECSASLENSKNGGTKCRCFHNFIVRARTSVYSNPLAILLLLAAGLCVHTQPSLTYLPPLGEENGLSPKQVPYLITTAGVFNLVGKLVIGYIADLSCCSKSRLYMVAVVNLMLGAVFHFIRLCDNFGLMLCLSVALGILSGVVDFMFPVVVSDILGKEHIGHMMSAFFLASGVFMSTDHVIVGALKDVTGYFYISYHYMGTLILIGVVVFMIVPFVMRLKLKHITGV